MEIAQRDRVLDSVFVAALWWGLIAGAWLGSQNECTPRTFLFIGAAGLPICGWLIYKRLHRFSRLKQGLEGEQSVGLFLKARTGKALFVQPVLLFPDCTIRMTNRARS